MNLTSPDAVVEIVVASAEVTIRDSSVLDVGFANATGRVVEGDSLMACVKILSGRLAEDFLLPLSIQVVAGQGNVNATTSKLLNMIHHALVCSLLLCRPGADGC